jgi:hypothetical protein
MTPFLLYSPKILKKNGMLSFFQYSIDINRILPMIRDEFGFGIEFLEFDNISDNTYYRLNDKNADGRYTAPLFLFRKI